MLLLHSLHYLQALRDGSVNVYRGRILLIGQDRAGKTSLKKSLTGRPFNPKEQSTEGIHVDPSTFEIDVDQVKNWQSVCENEQGLLGCSTDIAKIVTAKLPVYRPFKYGRGVSEYGEGDTDESDEDQEDENKDEDEKDESEEDQEIDNGDVDDSDTYNVEEEEEEKAEDSLVNQVCQFTILG